MDVLSFFTTEHYQKIQRGQNRSWSASQLRLVTRTRTTNQPGYPDTGVICAAGNNPLGLNRCTFHHYLAFKFFPQYSINTPVKDNKDKETNFFVGVKLKTPPSVNLRLRARDASYCPTTAPDCEYWNSFLLFLSSPSIQLQQHK